MIVFEHVMGEETSGVLLPSRYCYLNARNSIFIDFLIPLNFRIINA